MKIYDHQRPHLSISYMTPEDVHQTGMKTERKWENYYRKKKVVDDSNVAK